MVEYPKYQGYIDQNIQYEAQPEIVLYNISKNINEDAYMTMTHW